MTSRTLEVCLAIGLIVSFSYVVVYVLKTRKSHRDKDEDEDDEDDPKPKNFQFLSDAHCIQFIRNSKVMFIMRGLPGSGKSTIANQIKKLYGDLAVICSADNFRINHEGEYTWKPEEYGMPHLMCEEKARQACQKELPVVIIDNTNIKKRLLYWYIDTARSNGYYVVLVEPETSWKYNISELALKNHHQVSEEILRRMCSEFEQIIAKYYGWFPSENCARTIKYRMMEAINGCCATIPLFQDDLQIGNESQDDGQQENSTSSQTSSDTILLPLSCLEHIQDKLHVTSFYNKRGEALQAHNYVSSPALQDALGSVTTLMIIAWTITPRTVTARVKLDSKQIELWNNHDSFAFEEGSIVASSQRPDSSLTPLAYHDLILKPTVGKGDTAHITLSHSSDVTPVQGRYDLRDLIRLELANSSYEELKLPQGLARRYSDGLYAVYLNKPLFIDALFTGYY
ncbi:2',3'-cyclic-nucleotide 3'-phosphodiesterase-like isoform X1 [Montipora foliosa]|uniref:2',3'-cyclic-nucleotide 3'-phosphodiesterase-like isoform X1 n=1 Tax=Montipora foliosa TaxID=591990 RepID=UPI0035F1EDA1